MADLTREEAVEAMALAMCRKGGRDPQEIMGLSGRTYLSAYRYFAPAALDALLSLLAERGWQVVPVVADEAMLLAALDTPPTKQGTARQILHDSIKNEFAAMLAAAPAPLSEETPHAR